MQVEYFYLKYYKNFEEKNLIEIFVRKEVQMEKNYPLYKTQFFGVKVQKLSNRGWKTHERVLALDDVEVMYYKKVPKDFDKDNDLAKLGAAPKKRVKLIRICNLGSVDHQEKKSKILKRPDAEQLFFKICFYKDGLASGDMDDSDEGEEEDELNKSKSSFSKSQLGKSGISKPPQTLTWFIRCESNGQRDELIAQIYINALNRWRVHGYNNLVDGQIFEPPEGQLTNGENEKILDVFIKRKMEEENYNLYYKQTNDNQTYDSQENDQDDNSEDTSFRTDPEAQSDQNQVNEIDLMLQNENNLAMPDNNLQKNLQNKDKDDKFEKILEQNILINNQEKVNNGGKDKIKKKKELSPKGLKLLQTQIDERFLEQEQLEQDQREKEAEGWDLKFQNYWGYIKQAGNKMNQSLPMCEKLFKHVGEFRGHTTSIAMKIIEDLHKPEATRDEERRRAKEERRKSFNLKPIDSMKNISQKGYDVYLDEADNSLYLSAQLIQASDSSDKERHMVFQHMNILYKISHPNEFVYTTGDQSTGGETGQGNISLNQSMDVRTAQNASDGGRSGSVKNIQKSIQGLQKTKLYGRQFLSMDIMFDALFLLSKPDSDYSLRVPLSAIIDYKGFRCLAIGLVPILARSPPLLGFDSKGKYQEEGKVEGGLKDAFQKVGEALNLAPNQIGSDQGLNTKQVPVSFFTKIYDFQDNQEDKMKQNKSIVYENSKQYHLSELEYAEKKNIKYVLKTSEIFPYDQENNDSKKKKEVSKILRPEFFIENVDQLQADAMKEYHGLGIGLDTGNSKDNVNTPPIHNLSEASKYLKMTVIKTLVEQLDDMTFLPIDSESLGQLMHQQGINMRYLSYMAVLSQIPHVREICVTEMLARTCKNILNLKMSELILDNKTEYKQYYDLNEKMHLAISEKINYIKNNKSNVKSDKDGQNVSNHKIDINFDEESANEEKEGLKKDKEKIEAAVKARKDRDMHKDTREFMIDILNLIFGRGEETDYFWNQILIPECSKYFEIQQALEYYGIQATIAEILNRKEINLNALFYAIQYLFGFEIDPFKAGKNDDNSKSDFFQVGSLQYQSNLSVKYREFFDLFSKHERPFGEPEQVYQIIKIVARSKSYSLRNTPYRETVERIAKLKNEQKVEKALRCAQMKRSMTMLLTGKDDLITLADIAEIALEQGHNKIAIRHAEEGLSKMVPLHAERLRLYCILIRAYFADAEKDPQGGKEHYDIAERFFKEATDVLDHHLGGSHPLHITVYGIMAYLLARAPGVSGRFDEASLLHKSSILVCLKTLGPNHVQTAHVHMDFAQFYLKWEKSDQALSHFEQAFVIYKSYFTHKKQVKNPILTADAAMQIANILEEQNRLNEAYSYVEIASETYHEVYGAASDNTIIAQWIKLQIAYSQGDHSVDVVGMADDLYQALLQRDTKSKTKANELRAKLGEPEEDDGLENTPDALYEGYDDADVDELKEEMEKIKILCIATHIMEMTRILPTEDKKLLSRFCDEIQMRKYEREKKQNGESNFLRKQLEFYSKNINIYAVRKVTNVEFKEEEDDIMKSLFKKAQRYNSFRVFYEDMLNEAISKQKEKSRGDQQTVQNQTKQQEMRQLNDINFQTNQGLDKATEGGAISKGGITSQAFGHQTEAAISTLDEAAEADTVQEIFSEILDAFYHINFYNLLNWPMKKENTLSRDKLL